MDQNQISQNKTTLPNIPPLPSSSINTNQNTQNPSINTVGSFVNSAKFSKRKKIIATVLSTLLLMIGIGTGVYLSQKTQDIREKAARRENKCDDFDYGLCNPDGTCKRKGVCMGCCRGKPSSTPAPNSTRPDLCISATVNNKQIGPGETITISSKANGAANYFMYAVYNMDNLYPPPPENNPKPVCVKNGGDITTARDICPEGSHLLIFEDPNKELRTEGKRTIRYEDLFVKDELTGKIVSNISITAYFQKEGEAISVPKPECVVRTISSKTSGPQPECLDVRAYAKDGETWIPLDQEDLSSLEPGDKIYITVTGKATNPAKFTKAKFKINNGEEIEVSADSNKKPTNNSDETEIFYEYTIPPKVNSFTIKAAIYHQDIGWIGTTR